MKVSELQKQTPRTLAIKVHQRELRIEYLEKRIAELSKNVDELEEELLKTTHPNSEPIAYVNSMCNDCIDWKVEPINIDGKPLYTTPQIKELSDEEIEQIAVKWYVGTRILPIGFARAILKKASEK